MKVEVDTQRCQGHARCLTIASEIFDFDEEADRAVARPPSELTGIPAARALAAVQACPEQAISIFDADEGAE